MAVDPGTLAQARDALAGVKHRVPDALEHVPAAPGLYAIWADEATWRELGLGTPGEDKPLYVGKAEDSLVSRDIQTHFMTGKTGSSTVRRSFAALLVDHLGLHAVPRNALKPERPANFGLPPADDERLTDWMQSRLVLATWPKSGHDHLGDIETAVLALWQPPLNLSKVARPDPRLKQARRVMADHARAWAKERGFDI